MKTQTGALACVILAAGKGTRMRSKLPKVMHCVAHKPMLYHVIDAARALKAETIICVTSPDMQPVRDTVARHYSTVTHAVQPKAQGTGDAVRMALPALQGFEGNVLILYGDAPLIRPETLERLAATLLAEPHAGLALIGMEATLPHAYGRLVLGKDSELERIVEVQDATEKEKSITLCNSGVMIVRGKLLPELLAAVDNNNAKGEYYLTDIVALARAKNHRCAVVVAENATEMLGVNSRAELACAEANMQQLLRARAMEHGATLLAPQTVFFAHDTRLGEDVVIHPNVVFGPGVEVAHGVEIRSFSHIEGAKIWAHAIIGPFARLRPGTTIGEGAHIGNFVEVKKSTIGNNAKANHLTYIGDAHVGEATNIGAGTITANYDGFNKHRTVIGDNVSVGADCVLVAPINIGDGAVIGAGSVVTEDVESDALALARAPQTQKRGWAKSTRREKQN